MSDKSGDAQKRVRTEWQNRIVGYRVVKASELAPNDKNWRKHPKRQKDALTDVLDKIGWVDTVLYNVRTGRLIDGHLRQSLNPDVDVPVLDVDLSEEEELLVLATFDPIGAMAEADKVALEGLLSALSKEDETLAGLLGAIAEDNAIQMAGDGGVVDAPPQIDKAGELRELWQTERGQVWVIDGKHRVMCGDSTSGEDVARLLENRIIDATITDPPYMTTDLDFDETGISFDFWRIAQSNTHKNGYFAMFAPMVMIADCAKDWHLRFTGVWVKPAGGMRTHSAKKPMSQSETYAVFAHPEHKIADLVWNGVSYEGEPYKKVQRNTGYKRGGNDQLDRSTTSTWTNDGFVSVNDGTRDYTDTLFGTSKPYMKHDERTIHPTQKPVEVVSVIIQWLTNPNMLVYEPFLGSGTTLIACAQTGRVCYGMEIAPEYVAVVLQRAKDAGMSCEKIGV